MTTVETPSRRARITWAKDIQPRRVVWAWHDGDHGRIPAGSLAIFAGREATGKSSCAIWTAGRISRGTLPGTLHGRPGNVLYVAVEDSWAHTLVPRLKAADADLSRVGRFDVVSAGDDELILSLPEDNALLGQAIGANQVAAVIIDPLMSVMGVSIDTHREREVRTALDPLAKLAERTGCLILGIAHFNKGSSTDAASLITGSGAFKNVPRSVFGFAQDDTDGTRVMTQVKNSLGRTDLPSLSYAIDPVDIEVSDGTTSVGRFTFTGESDRTVADVLRSGRDGGEDAAEDRRSIDEWLVEYLSASDRKATEVYSAADAAGFSKDQVKKAKKRVGAEAKHPEIDGPWLWSLPSREPLGSQGSRDLAPTPLAPLGAPLEQDTPAPTCHVCHYRLDHTLVDQGLDVHPGCEAKAVQPAAPSGYGPRTCERMGHTYYGSACGLCESYDKNQQYTAQVIRKAKARDAKAPATATTPTCGHPPYRTSKCPICLVTGGAA